MNSNISEAASSTAIDKADTTWTLISTVLVFMMIPGCGYFYSGLSRDKNKLSVLMFTLVSFGVTTLTWFLWNYSLAFSTSGSSFIGDFKHIALVGVHTEPTALAPTIPHKSFMLYQCMFACVAAALVFGSGIERATLRSYIVFLIFWNTLVYAFVAYWVWGLNGWLRKLDVLDFSGGTPVHIVSGFSALSFAIIVGPRKEFHDREFVTHNAAELYLGTSLLWVGWIGFNAGSGFEIGTRAVNAATVSLLAGAFGGLTWMFIDMTLRRSRKMNVTAFCNGAIAGLVTITPACGYVSPASSLVFGFLGGSICVFTCKLKHYLGYDDAADVFGIHGVAGILGGLLTGIFADSYVADATIRGGWVNQHYVQLGYQIVGILAGASWSFVMTSLILIALKYIPYIDLKAPESDEERGIDAADIGEISFGAKAANNLNYFSNVPRYQNREDLALHY